MKYIKQFAIILAVSFIGEILHALIPLSIPASIYGIILLFLALEFKIIPIESVRETGIFLVEIMPIMFIPAAVGLLETWDIIRPSIAAYLIITVISTITVMAASGKITQFIIKRKKKVD